MRKPPLVLVLMGGPDAERRVSVASGTAVADALEAAGYPVRRETVDRPGLAELEALPGEVVFPALHGPWGEGGPLQEILEAIERPYVGSGPAAAALAMDKVRTKDVARATGVLTPDAVALEPGAALPIEPPLVLKPVANGSSVDVFICRDEAEVCRAMRAIEREPGTFMVERYVPGRELTVGIVAGEPLPIVEIAPKTAFYDYDAKYERADTGYAVAPDLPPGASEACREASLALWRAIGCRDVARADFRLDPDGGVWFLEINTMPGFTDHSLVPLAAARVGLPMPALCARLVEEARRRHRMDVAGPARPRARA